MIEFSKKIVQSKLFTNFIIGTIILAGVLVGMQTYPKFYASTKTIIDLLDQIVLIIFIIEIILKMLSHYPNPLNYFKDPWNIFDFTIVAVCLLPLDTQYVAILRLARIFRVLRLISALPKLQIIVGGLLRSIPSMIYVVLLLLLHFYIFSAMAVTFFGENDPWHFGNLQYSFLSLFRGVTLEDWTDLMYIQMYGSDHYGYNEEMIKWCTDNGFTRVSSAAPLGAAIFFVTFILSGAMIFINLFIGVILNGMSEMEEETKLGQLAKKREEDNIQLHDEMALLEKQLEDVQSNIKLLNFRLKQNLEKNNKNS